MVYIGLRRGSIFNEQGKSGSNASTNGTTSCMTTDISDALIVESYNNYNIINDELSLDDCSLEQFGRNYIIKISFIIQIVMKI
jgi:hypothetical protein